MAVEVRIGCFLEDIAQERLVTALIKKVLFLRQTISADLVLEVRNSTGGVGRALGSFEDYLRRWRSGSQSSYDALVVAIDGNCAGYAAKKKQILETVTQVGYPGEIICAIPNPHIEKWYLADPRGFKDRFGGSELPKGPRYKCERDRYKRALLTAFQNAEVEVPLGGAEYGDEIVQCMDLPRAEQSDRELRLFIRDLRTILPQITSQ